MCSRQCFVLKRWKIIIKSANKFKSVDLKPQTCAVPRLLQESQHSTTVTKKDFHPCQCWGSDPAPDKQISDSPVTFPSKRVWDRQWTRSGEPVESMQENSIYCRYKCSFVYSPWSVQIFVHQQYQLLQYTSISFSQAFVFTMSRPIWPKVSKTLWTQGVLCACSIQPFSLYIYMQSPMIMVQWKMGPHIDYCSLQEGHMIFDHLGCFPLNHQGIGKAAVHQQVIKPLVYCKENLVILMVLLSAP